MKRVLYILILLTFVVTGCAIFKGKGYITKISITYDTSRPINYGYTLPLTITAYYSKGKTKDITNKDDVYIRVEGATIKNNVLKFERYPKQFKEDKIKVYASYKKDDKIYKDSIFMGFNYRGSVSLYFNGNTGTTGQAGSDGGTSILFRHGKDGMDGHAGGQGEDGDDVTIYVWKESDLYYLKIYDVYLDEYFYYKANELTDMYKIYARGGRGGNGGKGGDGGDGKNGSNSKKIKSPGNGGNGGNGGSGGVGGKGGNIIIFIHPNAADFKQHIQGDNAGGNGGSGGEGGSGGKGGKPLEGQTAGDAGVKGTSGRVGIAGVKGDLINIEIQEFDIEAEKQN